MDLLKNKTLGSFLLSKVKWSRWQDSFKKQEFYETVHRTVFPKFVALCSRQIWIIPPQVRAFSILNNKKRDAKWKTSLFMVEVTGLEPAASWSQTTRATNCATPRSYSLPIIIHERGRRQALTAVGCGAYGKYHARRRRSPRINRWVG